MSSEKECCIACNLDDEGGHFVCPQAPIRKELDEARAEIVELKKILSVSDEGYRKLMDELRAAREGK